MIKYHFSPKTGKMERCSNPENCPYGGTHFENPNSDEAMDYMDQQVKKNINLTKGKPDVQNDTLYEKEEYNKFFKSIENKFSDYNKTVNNVIDKQNYYDSELLTNSILRVSGTGWGLEPCDFGYFMAGHTDKSMRPDSYYAMQAGFTIEMENENGEKEYAHINNNEFQSSLHQVEYIKYFVDNKLIPDLNKNKKKYEMLQARRSQQIENIEDEINKIESNNYFGDKTEEYTDKLKSFIIDNVASKDLSQIKEKNDRTEQNIKKILENLPEWRKQALELDKAKQEEKIKQEELERKSKTIRFKIKKFFNSIFKR